ncbi:MAG: hypothetical protein ACK553_00065, partial [Planctomycetota bacterium]
MGTVAPDVATGGSQFDRTGCARIAADTSRFQAGETAGSHGHIDDTAVVSLLLIPVRGQCSRAFRRIMRNPSQSSIDMRGFFLSRSASISLRPRIRRSAVRRTDTQVRVCISGSPQEKIAAHDIRHTDTFLFAFRINESGSGRASATTATNSIDFLFDSRVAELDPEPMFHVIAHEFVHLWGRHSLAIGQGDTPSQELTYQGGWLLAAWLDAAIRKKALADDNKLEFTPSAGDVTKPGTLDVLMRDFNNDPRWNKHVRPTPALFLERPAKY